MRVLIVDDDPQVLRLLRVNLELDGYEVVSACDGVEALEAIKEQDPDLVVCDVMMPGLDGIEVVRRLRADPGTVDVPVLLLSARAQTTDVSEGLDAGANAYMTKPFDPAELMETISAVLAERSTRT